MKKTNCKAYRTSLREYLLPIVAEALEARDLPTDGNLFARIVEVARREVPHEFASGGTQCGMEYWLSGLGMNVACYYRDIIELAQAWHGCELDARQRDTVCDGWFRHLAVKIIQFSSEGGVK